MKAKASPGPWYLCMRAQLPPLIVSADHNNVAEVYTRTDSGAEELANAKLLAGAWELRRAARALLEGMPTPRSRVGMDRWIALNLALRKAGAA